MLGMHRNWWASGVRFEGSGLDNFGVKGFRDAGNGQRLGGLCFKQHCKQ